MKILVYGGSGWIGQKIVNILKEKNMDYICGQSRLENYDHLKLEIEKYQPTHVFNCAGLTGRPNVDWCEDHREEVLRVNVLGASVLADICHQNCIHLTYFGTGCIYEYDKSHPYGVGFTETETPNFEGSFYSYTKAITEKILQCYENALILRIRMPLSDDLHPRNFITKITNYDRVVNVPNSMTILTELLPLSVQMATEGKTGIFNFTNPGAITHNEILELYQTYIDPAFTWKNFDLEEQSKILKAGRSNNELNVNKLLSHYPHLQHIKIAIVDLFKRMKHNLIIDSILPSE